MYKCVMYCENISILLSNAVQIQVLLITDFLQQHHMWLQKMSLEQFARLCGHLCRQYLCHLGKIYFYV